MRIEMRMHDDADEVLRQGGLLRLALGKLRGQDVPEKVEQQYIEFQQLARTLAPSQRRLRRASRNWGEAAVKLFHSGRAPWWREAEEAAFNVFTAAAEGQWVRAQVREARGLGRAAARLDYPATD